MTRRAETFLALLAATSTLSCGGGTPDPVDDAACRRLLDSPDSLDAFDWLKTPSPLVKRPGSMTLDDALALAYRLESAGAVRVVAVGLVKVDRGGPAEESRGAVVVLPDDVEKRTAVFRLYAKQVRNDGGIPRGDVGQIYLFVPWTRAQKGP